MRSFPDPRGPGPGTAGARFLQIGHLRWRALEQVFLRGVCPDLDALVGWEFRGMNTPAWARLLGIRKFMKGFYRPAEGGAVMGYNCPVAQNRLDEPWLARPDDAAPRRFGFYRVAPVDPTARDNAYLHALLLDYGRGGNGLLDPSRGLRDYLVQVDPADPDLFLGKAYYALGPGRLAVSYFVLERHRRARDAGMAGARAPAAPIDGPGAR